MSETPNFRWKNWNGNLTCVADLHRPHNLEDLQKAVRRASSKGRIRVAGNSCSWSPLVPTSGSLIGLERMDKVLAVDHNPAEPSITVECGISMRDLVTKTHKEGLSLISPTIFQGIAIGGAVGVGAHGTGLGASTLSDDILELTLVKPDGEILRLGQDQIRLLDAARVSLGTLGAIYSVKLRCAEAFNVNVEDRFMPIDEVLDGLDDILASYHYVELYWFPFSETMWVKLMNRTQEPSALVTWQQRRKAAIDYVCTMASGRYIIPFIANYLPGLTPLAMRFAPFFAVTPGITVSPANVEFHYQKAYPKCWDMSWGVPIPDTKEAWKRSMKIVEQYARDHKYPVNMVVHCRFIGASTGWLSPAYDRPICDIEIVTCKGTPGIEDFYQSYTGEMLAFPGARPHWGKYILSPREIRARYPKMEEFLALRAQMDPDGLFLNDFLEDAVFQLRPGK